MSTLVGALDRSAGEAGLRGRSVLVALSGGLDSVCLARGLCLLPAGTLGRIEVAHMDHGLRPGSAEDAAFCARLAAELGVPFHGRRLGPGAFRRGSGVQAEARRLRRGFLEEVAAGRGLDAVALGHHADDQAETVLYRLLRGVGPRGLGGMARWAPPYWRPLLPLRRAALEAAAREGGWPHREDPSNRSPRYLRNRIRAEVLPLLRQLNPAAEEALGRAARLAADDDALLTDLARAEFARLAQPEPEGLRFAAADVARLAPALLRRVLLAAWEAVGCPPAALESRHLAAVEELLRAAPGARPQRRAPVPGPGSFARSWGDLWVLGAGAWAAAPAAAHLAGFGREPLPGLGLAAVWGPSPPEGTPAAGVPPGGRVTVRSWRPGDRVGRAKVKDLLMEARLPAWRRRRAVVAEGGGTVFGLFCSGRAWATEGASGPGGALWLEPEPDG